MPPDVVYSGMTHAFMTDFIWDFPTHYDAALQSSQSLANALTSVTARERDIFPFYSTSGGRPESLGNTPGGAHVRRSSSGVRSERGAETWSEVASAPSQRPSPYPSPHTSPHLLVNSLSEEDSYASGSGSLFSAYRCDIF